MNKKNNNDNSMLVWILLIVIVIGVFLMPMIYDFVTKLGLPKSDAEEETVEKVDKVVDAETLNDIHFPIMRNSKYNSNSYYSLDTFKPSDMSNEDIMYNAFMGIENVNIVNNTIKAKYFELRINNILGKDVKYNYGNFYVPVDSKSNYKGYWAYDGYRGLFVYQGGNNYANTNIEYYDLTELIKAEYDNRDIVVYYYVGFAKVEGESYTIYSDPSYTNVITSGTAPVGELDTIFKNINKKDKKVYKYTFKNTICSYSEYCLYEGKWTNEF